MGRPEATFRTNFKGLIRKFAPVSIENALTTPGLPDLCLTTGWAELKILSKWPVRASTPLRIDHFTAEQKRWAIWWTDHGGMYWLVVKVAREIFLFNAQQAQKVGTLTRDEMLANCIAHFPKWPTPEEICPYFER